MEDYFMSRKDLRPATVRVYRICVEKYLKPWLDLPMREVTSDMVEGRHRAIASEVADEKFKRKGEIAANLAIRVFRVLWNFLADRVPDMPPNPVRRMKRQWFAEPRRERIVRTNEMPKFFEAMSGLDDAIARDFLLLVLFTGLRLHEASSLTWDDIDLPLHVIRVAAGSTKAGRKLDLPMSDFVRDLLVARRSVGKDKFVFPGAGKTGHLVEARKALADVAAACGTTVSAHDLRRTYITVAESADVSPMALKLLVNHSLGKDIIGGYVIMSAERLRDSAQRVADKMKELCRVMPATGDNVARLAG
jgi:integrase